MTHNPNARYWSIEDEDKLRELRDQGKSLKQCSRILRRGSDSVRSKARAMGLILAREPVRPSRALGKRTEPVPPVDTRDLTGRIFGDPIPGFHQRW